MLHLTYVIQPYCINKKWLFDDPSVGLHQEPLTDGVPEVLLEAVKASKASSLIVWFSKQPLLPFQLDHLRPLRNGNEYYWAEKNMKCWFCPALLKYFKKPPKKLFFVVRINNTFHGLQIKL